jgi:hypothetical protein
MKLVTMLYLEDDRKCVERFLSDLEVETYSELEIEGHGPGGHAGWYREAPPYRSHMVFAFVDDDLAGRILEAVRRCTAVKDPRHPIRAFLLDVQAAASCGCEPPGSVGTGSS